MTRLSVALLRMTADLQSVGRRFALVGGLAMSVRAPARFTQDVDLVMDVADDRDAEALVRWLLDRGYDLRSQMEQGATARLSTVRFLTPDNQAAGVAVDLLFASCGIEGEVARGADPVEVAPGVTVPVARREHLIAMKVLARDDVRRPQDHGDLIALLARADTAELDRAGAAVRLIETRGFARGKDLATELRTLVAETGHGG